MKKVLLSVMAFALIAPIMGQEAQVDETSHSLVQELKALPAQDQSFEQKLSSFEKAVEYLKGARDCLSGIGCTKRQSYLANYLLGATYGFAQSVVFLAIARKDPARWNGNPAMGQVGLGAKLVWLNVIVNELGYRYLVKEKVYLFRCLTFRGCTDQTKRYAFYNLGIWSGRMGAALIEVVRSLVEMKRQMLEQAMVKVDDNEVKAALNLDRNKIFFEWYEILGFKEAPSPRDARMAYRRLSLKYHPDKAKKDMKSLYENIQQALNAAKEKIENKRLIQPGVGQITSA